MDLSLVLLKKIAIAVLIVFAIAAIAGLTALIISVIIVVVRNALVSYADALIAFFVMIV